MRIQILINYSENQKMNDKDSECRSVFHGFKVYGMVIRGSNVYNRIKQKLRLANQDVVQTILRAACITKVDFRISQDHHP